MSTATVNRLTKIKQLGVEVIKSKGNSSLDCIGGVGQGLVWDIS